MNFDGGVQFIPTLPYHGAPAAYAYAVIPAINDPNWVNAPLDGSGNVAFSQASVLPSTTPSGANSCLNAVDFTFFQTLITIPALTQINTFTVSFTNVDDGARAYIFNSAYPNGAFIPGGDIIISGPPVTANLASLAVAGEVNRIVIAQYDDCRVANNVRGVQVIVNGTPIPVAATVTCPADITVNNATGQCGATVTYPPATADGNPTPAISYSHPSGGYFTVGTTVVNVTATNATGTASCSFNVTVVDNENPVANCKPATVTLVNGAASITAADVDNGSTDNCGIQSMSVSPSNFGCFDIGERTVTLTVTDPSGNTSSCETVVTVVGEQPKCKIKFIPTDNTYTGDQPRVIYLGYGPQSATLQVTGLSPSGAPYTYQWSTTTGLDLTDPSAPVFTPTAEGQFAFTVKVTNKYGCSVKCNITICVLDIRVPGSNGKVYVCHQTSSATTPYQSIAISTNAVSTHIFDPGHGDHLGRCDQVCDEDGHGDPHDHPLRTAPVTEALYDGPFTLSAYPNPSAGYFTVLVQSKQKAPVEIRAIDMFGRVVFRQLNVLPNAPLRIGDKLVTGGYLIEAVQGSNRRLLKVIKAKQ